MPAHRPRMWNKSELSRMQRAVEGGVPSAEIAQRFKTSKGTVQKLAAIKGWQWPEYAGPGARRKVSMVKPPSPPKGKHGSFFIKRAATPFEPRDGGCRVRTLTGAEFQKRKQELEARDRAERAHASLRTA